MQTERLFETLYLLLERRQISAAALAQRFGVSRRTIYRDLETLSQAGIPLYTLRGKNGGIRLMEGFVLDRALFSKEEQQELLSALESLKAFQDKDFTLSEKLQGLFAAQEPSWLHISFAPWSNTAGQMEKFTHLKQAICQRQVISFAYCNAKGVFSTRTTEPHRLVFRSQDWYLQAYCLERQAFRYFKLTRIQQMKITSQIFERRALPFEKEQAMPACRLISVTLWIQGTQGYRVYDDFPAADIHRMADDTFKITTMLPDNEYLETFLLSYGEALRVEAPESLRYSLRKRTARMAENFR